MLVLGLGLALPWTNALAQGTLGGLRGVDAQQNGEWTDLTIQMTGAFRYLTHSSGGDGRVVIISLRPEGSDALLTDRPGDQLIVWTHPDLIRLIDVEYLVESDERVTITLRFERPVDLNLSQGRDLEHLRLSVRERSTDRSAEPSVTVRPDAPAGPSDPRVDEIVEEGRIAMTAGNFGRAALLFTKALSYPEHPRSAEAKELLGLARQRSGQLAHAKAEYEEYLERYPDAEGAARVRQRLDALLTARRRPSERKKERPRTAGAFQHDFSGSVSQFYRRTRLDDAAGDSSTTNSTLDSDLYLTSRSSNRRYSIVTNFAGSYQHDLLDTDSSRAVRITHGFVEANDRVRGTTMRIGRQSARGGGVLGRFDGAIMSAQFRSRYKLNLVSGFPVDFSESNRVNVNRPFYGLSLDAGTFMEHLDTQLFMIRQEIDGIEDRTAVGGEVRFTGTKGFLLGLADYDLGYSALNMMMLIANWRIDEATTANALVDYRKSPILTTYNALQGQLVDEIDDLEDLYSDSEIRDLAEDRTATSRMVTLGLSRQLNARWQLSADATVSDLSDTSASGGVPATEGTGSEYFFALHATATGLLVERGYTTIGLRYADTDMSDRYSLSLGGRYPVVSGLRLGPRVSVELRRNETGEDQWNTRSSLRADYAWRRLRFEAEVGFDWTQNTTNDADEDERQYLLTLGSRYDF